MSGPILRGPQARAERMAVSSPGMPSELMGRIPNEGVLVSARLNPDIVAKLMDGDPENDVEATIQDVGDALPMEKGVGGKRKVRGGGPTRDAFAKLFRETKNAFVTTKGWVDEKVGAAVEGIPLLLKTVAVGTTLKYTLNNPTLFANIVHYATAVAKYLASTKEGMATWGDYLEAGKAIGGDIGDFIKTYATEPSTPAGTILLALFIMKYRASSAGKTMTELIKDDAAVLKEAAKGLADNVAVAALAQYSAFVRAVEGFTKMVEKKVVTANLKALAEQAKKSAPKGEGAREISVNAQRTGAPSVQMGPNGVVIAVPATKQRDYKDALTKLTQIPEKVSAQEQAAAAAVAAVVVGVGLPRSMGLFGGRHKTQKRSPKRRTTRRRTKVLGTPVFIY